MLRVQWDVVWRSDKIDLRTQRNERHCDSNCASLSINYPNAKVNNHLLFTMTTEKAR